MPVRDAQPTSISALLHKSQHRRHRMFRRMRSRRVKVTEHRQPFQIAPRGEDDLHLAMVGFLQNLRPRWPKTASGFRSGQRSPAASCRPHPRDRNACRKPALPAFSKAGGRQRDHGTSCSKSGAQPKRLQTACRLCSVMQRGTRINAVGGIRNAGQPQALSPASSIVSRIAASRAAASSSGSGPNPTSAHNRNRQGQPCHRETPPRRPRRPWP
jgi:hypothetical protein